MKPYAIVDESEAVKNGKIKEGYEKRAYCYVKLDQAIIAAEKTAQAEQSAIDTLVTQKLKDIAIAELKKEGKLDANGKLKK